MKVNTKDLRLAEVRYYDAAHNGLEYTKPLANVVLLNRGDTYISLLNPGDIAPIYKRVENTTNILGTEDYFGTKIEQVSGDSTSGEAWLLADADFTRIFGKEQVEIREVEDYVLRSNLFFKDRPALAADRAKSSAISAIRMRRIIEDDQVSLNSMLLFFAEREEQKVYQI